MTKKEIIDIVNEFLKNIDTEIFGDDNNTQKNKTQKNKIGCNQFRELAGICKHSECYDEIEMLIRYNEAKAIEENHGEVKRNSWAVVMKNNVSFAENIIKYIKKIKEASTSDEECLEYCSLFWGYLYWNARIYASKNKAESSGNSAHNTNIGNGNRNGNGHNSNNISNSKNYRTGNGERR